MENGDFYGQVMDKLGNHSQISMYSALNLAYLGDAVFELLVRTRVVTKEKSTVNKLHKKSRSYVNAQTQAQMYYKIADALKEEELAILKRGRNAKSFTTAKNASVSDYRHATGIEALFGYLFLKEDHERLMEIFEMCMEGL